MRCEPSFSYNLKCLPALNKSISKSENKLWDTTLVMITLFNLKIRKFAYNKSIAPLFLIFGHFASIDIKSGTLFEYLVNKGTNKFELNTNNYNYEKSQFITWDIYCGIFYFLRR